MRIFHLSRHKLVGTYLYAQNIHELIEQAHQTFHTLVRMQGFLLAASLRLCLTHMGAPTRTIGQKNSPILV